MHDTDYEHLRDTLDDARRSPEYAAERALLDFLEALVARMDMLGIRRSELATRMGVSRPMITKLLRGTGNLTLQTMTNAAQAVGCELTVSLSPTPSRDRTPPSRGTRRSRTAPLRS